MNNEEDNPIESKSKREDSRGDFKAISKTSDCFWGVFPIIFFKATKFCQNNVTSHIFRAILRTTP